MDLEPVQQTFLAESRELLAAMEEALLSLEKYPDARDSLDAVFRAAHTIKGSAGVFGFDMLVEFTHAMESVLSDLRAGVIAVHSDLIALLLSCGDHCGVLLDGIEASNALTEDAVPQHVIEDGEALVEQLGVYLSPLATDEQFLAGSTSLVQSDTQSPQEAELETIDSPAVSSESWHISLRFGKDVLRHGMDPLSFLRYLGKLGEIQSVVPLFDSMPDAAGIDPESCYLGLEIAFNGAVDKQTLENVFEFVHDDCAIHILPPRSKITDYIRLIGSLPEDKTRLGELLVNSGALTQRELDIGLQLQQSIAEPGVDSAFPADQRKLGEILVGQGSVDDALIHAVLGKQRAIKENRAQENSFLRVRADKLDELITLVGELVIAGAGTRLLAQRAGNSELLESTLSAEGLVAQIRDSALKLRMVPIGDAFTRFNRVVRDLGSELGKQIELELSGAETELDKLMIEKIGDPLMHLVRNALDHGIEAPQLRAQRGKPPVGRLSLNAYHDSGSIVIEVADDGGGLDREKILARAVERGLIAVDATLSDQDIFKLIMEPGFSTADQVTNVSGRGIGMDVVKRNVEALRGSVTIDSAAGEGTAVVIRQPLTLAIIDGFLVGVGRATYVVPLDMVVECMELSAAERVAIRNRSYINLRDQVLPLLRLRDMFETSGEAGRRENIVVVQCAGQQAGLVVDTLLGEFQTVIKPLGKLFEKLSGISGSTILGTGEVALILDVPALVQKASGREVRTTQTGAIKPAAARA